MNSTVMVLLLLAFGCLIGEERGVDGKRVSARYRGSPRKKVQRRPSRRQVERDAIKNKVLRFLRERTREHETVSYEENKKVWI